MGGDLTIDEVIALLVEVEKHTHGVGESGPHGSAAPRGVERPGTAHAMQHDAFAFEKGWAFPGFGDQQVDLMPAAGQPARQLPDPLLYPTL
jgi:hypothetical protein